MTIIKYIENVDLKVFDSEKNYADRNNSYEIKIFNISIYKHIYKSKEDLSEDRKGTVKTTGFK